MTEVYFYICQSTLYTLNSTANFFIYIVANAAFRKDLMSTFKRSKAFFNQAMGKSKKIKLTGTQSTEESKGESIQLTPRSHEISRP